MGEARPPNGFWCHAKIRIFSLAIFLNDKVKKILKAK